MDISIEYKKFINDHTDSSKLIYHCDCCNINIKNTLITKKFHFFSIKHQNYLKELEEIKKDFATAELIDF